MGTQHMNYCMECGTKLTIKPLKGEGQVPYCEHCRSFVFRGGSPRFFPP